jgi:hypothetical protein
VPKWSDFGNVWTTLRELDVNAIRDEAERPVVISCVGHDIALDAIDQLLHQGHERYPVDGPNPLELIPLARAAGRAASLNTVDLLMFALDTRTPLSAAELASFGRLDALTIPFLVVQLYNGQLQGGDIFLNPMIRSRTITIADPAALDAADRLASAVLGRLPSELQLAATRRLPGLRAIFARELIGNVAFSNATYSLASGLPEQIPVINVPFAAADILVLTKNQALLVYRLALAYGAPPDFQARIREVLPVIGGAFLWRQAARSLIGLIPVWGLHHRHCRLALVRERRPRNNRSAEAHLQRGNCTWPQARRRDHRPGAQPARPSRCRRGGACALSRSAAPAQPLRPQNRAPPTTQTISSTL